MREMVSGDGWRISLASVLVDGPFSHFPGVDRLSVLLKGNNLSLRLADGTSHGLRQVGDAARYPGDVPTTAKVFEGHELLNVMTSRGHRRSDLLPVFGPASSPDETRDLTGPALLFALRGHIEVTPSDSVATSESSQTSSSTWVIDTERFLFVESGTSMRLRLINGSADRQMALITIRTDA